MLIFEILNVSLIVGITLLVYYANDTNSKTKSIIEIFQSAAIFLIEKVIKYNYSSKYDILIFNKYSRLYGKQTAKKKYRYYFAEKIAYMMIGLLIISIFSILFCIISRQNDIEFNGNYLIRPKFENSDQQVNFNVKLEKDGTKIIYPLTINVKKQQPTLKEQQKYFNEFITVLGKYMEEHKQISTNLFLPTEVKGIQIKWVSNNVSYINNKGEITNKIIKQAGETVKLIASIKYYDQSVEKTYDLLILPPKIEDKNELLNKMFEELKNNLQDGIYYKNDKLILPKSLPLDKETKITWKQAKNNDPIVFFCLGSLCILVIFFIKDKELQRKIEEKELKMKLEFPNFISKFTLLMNAGMNISKALEKIVNDYNGRSPLYEELKKTLYEIKSGTYENQAIINLGYRNELIEIKKFSNLINQNLKKGNDELLVKLGQLNHELWQDRKQAALRLGEEAETKMLLPMIIMLIVLIIIVITPAIESLKF